jgi:hypothetical protein
MINSTQIEIFRLFVHGGDMKLIPPTTQNAHQLLKALADVNRLRIFEILLQGKEALDGGATLNGRSGPSR